MICADFSPEHFFTGGMIIMDYGLIFQPKAMVRFLQLLCYKHADLVFSRWTGVLWIIVMFLSDSHSDGTHSLQSIHYWDTDTETHFSKSDEEINLSTSWTTWECISVFGWTVPLTQGVNRATNLQYEHVLHICVCVQQYTEMIGGKNIKRLKVMLILMLQLL